jgi:hypothetical protein
LTVDGRFGFVVKNLSGFKNPTGLEQDSTLLPRYGFLILFVEYRVFQSCQVFKTCRILAMNFNQHKNNI